MQRFVIQIIAWLLSKNLSIQNRTLLINLVLDRLSSLPIKNIIVLNENGSLVINGKELDQEEMHLLQDNAKNLRDNRAFGLIQDQVLHNALSFGLNASTTLEMLYTSKAAVWWGMEQNKLIKLIAGESESS